MPGIDGLEVVTRIRATQGDLPVILFTSFDDVCARDERAWSATACVEKREDLSELKKVVADMVDKSEHDPTVEQSKALMVKEYEEDLIPSPHQVHEVQITRPTARDEEEFHPTEIIEESLSLSDKENEMIKKALEKHRGKRKNAARELGISERTLYRKIKEYNIKQ